MLCVKTVGNAAKTVSELLKLYAMLTACIFPKSTAKLILALLFPIREELLRISNLKYIDIYFIYPILDISVCNIAKVY